MRSHRAGGCAGHIELGRCGGREHGVRVGARKGAPGGAARRSATEAEKDAGSARKAADGAEADASTARDVASTADKDATAAEKYAEGARDHAKAADEAAARTEKEEREALQADRKEAFEKGDTAVIGGGGSTLPTDDEGILRVECGQKCVDQFRQAQADANANIIDWVKENGWGVLLEALGVQNVKRCLASHDAESCLWAIIDIAAMGAVFAKLAPVAKALVAASSRVGQFFERAEEGKRVVTRFKNLIERARKAPACPRALSVKPVSGVAHFTSPGAHSIAAAANPRCEFISGPIPDALEINRGSLVKIRDKQLEKALKTIDEDAHSFKEGYVGKGAISRFDAMRDDMNRIILVSKDGKVLVPTNVRYVP
ncbi:hypothetical protein AB0C81_15580 [Streptomyces roseoverticillatus]|uniref:hypothetical protein n=1 Tax=Streptomyces roseoverticillatus TaxID=66429 RepID=UPI0033DBD8E0